MLALRTAPSKSPGARALAAAATRTRDGKVRLGVQLRQGADPTAVERAGHGQGASTAHRLDALGFLSLTVPAAAADAVAAALSRHPDVVAVAPVQIRAASYVPNDPLWTDQQPYLSAVAAPAAWDVTHGSAAVRIAVIDTGVDVAHPDLAGKVVAQRNTIAGDVATDVTDNVGHGTHVAGIAAAASDNAQGVVGTGFDASVLAVKAGDVDGFLDDDIAAGITWAADNGARVINLSLGGISSTPELDAAVAYAQGKGVLIVAAAGNESSSAKSYPAAIAGVVAVGATDAAGQRAVFSNYGPWVTVAAPGMSIASTVPTAGSEIDPAPTSGYAPASGTSMASPIVAGQAALLMGAVPNATAAQVRQAIVASAHDYAGLGLGTGQVDLALALTKLPPATAPTLTSPDGTAPLSGVVTLTATTTEPQVRFLVDGTPLGTPADVVGGTAGASWETWGVTDGQYQVAAIACNAIGCGPSSAAVTVTVQNPAAAITSPGPGTAASGLVGLDVTTSDAAPAVRLVVDGQPVGVPVPVTANAAHLVWDSAGYANGSRTVAVAPCTTLGVCGTPAGIALDLQNAAPAVTAPAGNQVVSGPFRLTAAATSGGVRFLLDGRRIGFDGTAPYELVHNFSLVVDGAHQLTAQACSATESLCAGPATTVPLTARSLHPRITTTSPSVFSPNGDGRAERTTFSVHLPDMERASWYVRNAAGTVVRGPVGLGTLAAGTHAVVWDGRTSSGARVGIGTYTLSLDTVRATTTGTLRGFASRLVTVDTVAPTQSVGAVTSTFYPYVDGYRDTLVPRARVNEPGLLTMTVRNSAGRVVRTLTLRHGAAGTFSLAWNGRNNAGTLQAAGTYRYALVAQDAALNRRTSSTYSVPLSWKRLVGASVARTVTPAGTKTGQLVGSCSRLVADPVWSGGLDYESGWTYFEQGACPDATDPILDVVATHHQVTLPAAVKYSGISLTATGQQELPQHQDVAYAWYRDAEGNGVGGTVLQPDFGTYSLGSATSSLLYAGRALRWTVATDEGQYYAVKAFTVRYTYYLLK